MLIKAFELKQEFPFFVNNGNICVGMKTLMPVNPKEFTEETRENYRKITPHCNNPINFYGITSGNLNLRMVVVSDGLRTYFYWFTKRNRYNLMVRYGSRDLEEAWLHLFKWIITNPGKKCSEMYAVLKHFMREYFKFLGEKELNLTLSTKHDNELLYIEVIKESFMRNAMSMIVNGKRRTVDFKYHPLLEVLEAK